MPTSAASWPALARTDFEPFDALAECNCPGCGGRLALITYSTHEEKKENWDKLSEEEKRQWHER